MLIQNIDSTSTLIETKNIGVFNLYEALSMNSVSVYHSCLTWIAVVDALLGTGLLREGSWCAPRPRRPHIVVTGSGV
jgi:hypothetical protein